MVLLDDPWLNGLQPDNSRPVPNQPDPPAPIDTTDIAEWEPPGPNGRATTDSLAHAVERAALEILDASEHAHRVDNMPPVSWLIRGLWPADAHGVIAAEQKAGKTWANLDLVVSVASGTPWMGVHPIDTTGPVLVFLGEGGQRKMLRRLRAICTARGLVYETLPIRVCFRVPHLTSQLHLGLIADEIERTRPALVVVDPLYLASRGAKTSQLNEMGEHLENLQHVAQHHGAALAVIHHWNKTGEGKGAKRMTGAGGAEWGRVLVSVGVLTKHTDKATKATTVILEWDFEGDEIADTSMRIKRRVWTDNPDDLNSPMHYQVEVVDDDPADADEYPQLKASSRRVVMVLRESGEWMTVTEVGDALADQGHPLKKRTIQDALKEANDVQLVRASGDPGTAFKWKFNDADR